MSLQLSSQDIRKLQLAMSTMLSPWEAGEAESWREAVCRAVREALDVESAASIWRTHDRPVTACVGALTQAALSGYVAEWHGQLVGERRRRERRLRTWVREDVWKRKEVANTAYYHEYCVPSGFRDSAGMVALIDGAEQHIIYTADGRQDRFQQGGREALLLQLLQPALQAGSAVLHHVGAKAELLDAVHCPIAILDLKGQLLHANESFLGLAGDDSKASPVVQAARRLSIELANAREGASRNGVAATPWRSPNGQTSLSAVLWATSGIGSTPLCVVAATDHHQSRPAVIEGSWSLTRREAEVATLLARGCANAEVARALDVSAHTARRHTERVLQKLGVHSRAAVAAVINEGTRRVEVSSRNAPRRVRPA